MLRKILLTLPLVALYFIGLDAQTEKGTFSIGLNTGPGLHYSANTGHKNLLLNGSLRAGYFAKNNFMIGAEYGLSHFKFTYNGEESASSNGFHTGLFARKYYDLKNPKWKPFIEVGAGFNHGESSYQSINATQVNIRKNTGYARAEIGMAYFINKNTSLNLSYAQQVNFGNDFFQKTGGLKVGINFHFDGKKNK